MYINTYSLVVHKEKQVLGRCSYCWKFWFQFPPKINAPFLLLFCLHDMLWHCCHFSHREEEKLMIWDKTKTIVSECKTILDRIKTLYTSYAAKLPENVAKAVHNGQQRYHMSQQIVAVEDRVPDISNKQLVTITENFRLLSNTLDFVQQAIRKCNIVMCCMVQYSVYVYDRCQNNMKIETT